jgi:hypothetical protein
MRTERCRIVAHLPSGKPFYTGTLKYRLTVSVNRKVTAELATIQARPLSYDKMDHVRRYATEATETIDPARSLLRRSSDCARCAGRWPRHHAKSLWDSVCHCNRFFWCRHLSTSEGCCSFFNWSRQSHPCLESAKTLDYRFSGLLLAGICTMEHARRSLVPSAGWRDCTHRGRRRNRHGAI